MQKIGRTKILPIWLIFLLTFPAEFDSLYLSVRGVNLSGKSGQSPKETKEMAKFISEKIKKKQLKKQKNTQKNASEVLKESNIILYN